VLEPPSVRLCEDDRTFAFANPAAIRSPGAFVARPDGRLDVAVRVVAVIGLDGEIGGYTGLAEFRAPELATPKDRDFALVLGPIVDTELDDDFGWAAAAELAARHTRLRPGDLLGGPVREVHEDVPEGAFRQPFAGLGDLTALVA
jgi:hypothetical protein